MRNNRQMSLMQKLRNISSGSVGLGGCVEVTKTDRNGYGSVSHNGRTMGAHRASYLVHIGHIPDGMVVRHACDNPSCINPRHLRIGTQLDNIADRVERGRTVTPDNSGERNGMSKLSMCSAERIFKLVRSGVSRRDVAVEFGVSIGTVGMIVSGKRWRLISQEAAK